MVVRTVHIVSEIVDGRSADTLDQREEEEEEKKVASSSKQGYNGGGDHQLGPHSSFFLAPPFLLLFSSSSSCLEFLFAFHPSLTWAMKKGRNSQPPLILLPMPSIFLVGVLPEKFSFGARKKKKGVMRRQRTYARHHSFLCLMRKEDENKGSGR